MSWVCQLVDEGSFADDVGTMWFARLPTSKSDRAYLGVLSEEYFRDHYPDRAPLIVMLPTYDDKGELYAWPWCVDSCMSDPPYTGWTVTGRAPHITVTPSIHAVWVWHGWLRDGVISDA